MADGDVCVRCHHSHSIIRKISEEKPCFARTR